jgi:hypothetical protein
MVVSKVAFNQRQYHSVVPLENTARLDGKVLPGGVDISLICLDNSARSTSQGLHAQFGGRESLASHSSSCALLGYNSMIFSFFPSLSTFWGAWEGGGGRAFMNSRGWGGFRGGRLLRWR